MVTVAGSVKVGDRFAGGTVAEVDVGRWSTYALVVKKPGMAGFWLVVERHPRQLALDLGVG